MVEGADGGVVELWPSCRRGTLKKDTCTISTEAVLQRIRKSPGTTCSRKVKPKPVPDQGGNRPVTWCSSDVSEHFTVQTGVKESGGSMVGRTTP